MKPKTRKKKTIDPRRKEAQAIRIKRQERALREKIGPMISEAEVWRISLETTIGRLEPMISRDRFGEISFKKKLGKEQLERTENTAKAFLEKYQTLNKGYKRYVRLAKAAGLEPAAFGKQLSIIDKGADKGIKIRLASIEASRLLKAIEAQSST